MEGRWTICYVAPPMQGVVSNALVNGPHFMTQNVPVVPCDGPAIERGAVELRSMLGDVIDDAGLREMATRVLQAAGETP